MVFVVKVDVILDALLVASLENHVPGAVGGVAGAPHGRFAEFPSVPAEGPLRDLCMAEEIGVITYYSLAQGFLTGKYRGEADLGQSPRGGGVKAYLNPRGLRILAALDEVAARRGVEPAAVALAWLVARPGVTAPIASATSLAQLEDLVRAATLELSGEDVAALDRASAP